MNDAHLNKNQKRTSWVVVLTAITMVVEIIFGLTTKSMALLADGIHMGSHVLAIGLSWVAYIIVRKVFQGESINYTLLHISSLSHRPLFCCISTSLNGKNAGRL